MDVETEHNRKGGPVAIFTSRISITVLMSSALTNSPRIASIGGLTNEYPPEGGAVEQADRQLAEFAAEIEPVLQNYVPL